MKVGKFLVAFVFSLIFMAQSCLAMKFSQPVEFGTVIAVNIGGFGFKNESANDGTLVKNTRRGAYEKGVARFGNGEETIYFHYKLGTIEKKHQDTVMAFGDKDIKNTVPVNLMYAKIFKISENFGRNFYLIENGYDLLEETEYILIGKTNDGKWVKYFNTRDIAKTYFGVTEHDWGLAFTKPEARNDTIIIHYQRNLNGKQIHRDNVDENGEFRFKWDDAAQWFSVEQIKYSESQVSASQAQSYVEQGENLYKSGKHREALEKYNQAISLNPNFADAYIARSVVLYVDSRTIGTPADQVKAMDDINRAIKLNPNSARAYNWRASMNHYKNPNSALNDINYAIKLDPQYLDAYETRAGIYSDTKKYDSAIEDYTYILNNPNFKNSYMQHYDFDMMSDWAWYSDWNQRTAALYYKRGKVYREQGDTTNATADFKKALKFSPNNGWIKRYL